MADDDDDVLTACAQDIEAGPDQETADPLSLDRGKYGHGSQGDRCDSAGGSLDRHPAEQDVADDLTVQLGHQREQHEAAPVQRLHEGPFIISAERRGMDPAHGQPILGEFGANRDRWPEGHARDSTPRARLYYYLRDPGATAAVKPGFEGRSIQEVRSMKTPLFLAAAALVVLAASAPIVAHHAFAAEFDGSKPVTLKGTVTKMEWINPHAWLHVDVPGPDGKVVSWMVEGGAPNALLRRGWNRNSVVAGTKVVVEGFRARDGSNRANGRDVTLPDGTKLFIGSSGTGAPVDRRDSSERR